MGTAPGEKSNMLARSAHGYVFGGHHDGFYLYNVSGHIWTWRGLVLQYPYESHSLFDVGGHAQDKNKIIAFAESNKLTFLETHLPLFKQENPNVMASFGKLPMIVSVIVFFLGYQWFSGNKKGGGALSSLISNRRGGRNSKFGGKGS
eukprot:UN25927